MERSLRIGTRNSTLALEQTRQVIRLLQAHWPQLQVHVHPLLTSGDRQPHTPLATLGRQGGEGIFNKALEEALLAEDIDVATASLKDVESELASGVHAVCVGPRADPRDALVSAQGQTLAQLPLSAQLGCSSPRRTGQLLALRPDLRIIPLRGNVPTRIAKGLERHDGVILAAAGLLRLGLQNRISQYLPLEQVLPAPAQGALACQFLGEREDLAALLAPLVDTTTHCCVSAERTLLRTLSGGCFAPIGAYAQPQAKGQLELRGRVTSLDGTRKIEGTLRTSRDNWAQAAAELASRMKKQGAAELVHELRYTLFQSP